MSFVIGIFAVLTTHLAEASLPGQVIDITAGDFFFQAPATASPGLTTIRFRSLMHGHQFDVYRLERGHTVTEFVNASAANQPTPWATELGGAGFPPPKGTINATYLLEPGKYAILCSVHDAKDGKRHYQKGMYSEITVIGKRVTGMLPTPDITVTEVDYAWRFSRPVAAGRHVLRVINAGKEYHEFKILRVLPGHTAAQSLAWKPGQPPVDTEFFTVTAMGPGVSVLSTVDIPAGQYTIFCVPQMKHGMMQALIVR